MHDAESKLSPRETVELFTLAFTSKYMRRLMAHREGIRARLLNPGGSVILTGVSRMLDPEEYSGMLGNDLHLDLMQAELEITNQCQFPGNDREPACTSHPFTDLQRGVLMEWANALSPELARQAGVLDAYQPGAILRNKRRVRKYAVDKLTDRMNENAVG